MRRRLSRQVRAQDPRAFRQRLPDNSPRRLQFGCHAENAYRVLVLAAPGVLITVPPLSGMGRFPTFLLPRGWCRSRSKIAGDEAGILERALTVLRSEPEREGYRELLAMMAAGPMT